MGSASAFVSCSWHDNEDKKWARDPAACLRGHGVGVILDKWHPVPGDQLPEFMETGVRENDCVLVVCTPCYKEVSDKTAGSGGHQRDVVTGEAMTTPNQPRFIAIPRRCDQEEAAPSCFAAKYYLNLSGSQYSEENYQDLLTTTLRTRPGPPPVTQAEVGRTAES